MGNTGGKDQRDPNKDTRWVKAKYFKSKGLRNWVFAATENKEDGTQREFTLLKESATPIQRHVKIKADANPHDPQWEQYFESRWGKKMLNSARGRKKLYRVWLRQDGSCPVCQERITKDSPWTVQHSVRRIDGGTDAASNTLMLHLTCRRKHHNAETRSC